MVEVLNAIYETDFLGFSYGFRPGRSQHDALDALAVGMHAEEGELGARCRHPRVLRCHRSRWLVKFLEHRIADRRVVRLIRKWLRAGVLEDGELVGDGRGRRRGQSASPLLANVYLHYVFDRWVRQWRRRHAHGDVIIVRSLTTLSSASSIGLMRSGSSHDLRERFAEFGLELHPDKTRLIEFGRFAAERRDGTGRREAGDVRLPRLHAHLRDRPGTDGSAQAHHDLEADAGKATRGQ